MKTQKGKTYYLTYINAVFILETPYINTDTHQT